MDNKIFVTTFNKELFDRYAHTLLDSYRQTKQLIKMYVFVEDTIDLFPRYENVIFKNLYDEEPNCREFVKRNKNRPVKDFFKDAVRFSYKVFAQNAARKYGQKIYYVDSDSVFVKQIPIEWFDSVLPDDTFISFYDRPTQYTETGFVAFNESKLISKAFFTHYLNYYINDSVYKLNSYTDCHTLDGSRKQFKDKDIHYKEKSLGDGRNGHIMARCPIISPYLDHRKGNRKNKQHSPEWRGKDESR